MSVKIFHGVKFKNKDIRSLLDDFIREKQNYVQTVHQYFVNMILKIEDLKSKFESFDRGMRTIHNLKDMTLYYFEASFVIFPFEDKFYGIPFFYGDRFPKMKYLKYDEFGYWDNTDKPDDISDDEWQERYRVWSAVLIGEGKDGIPANNGFTFQIFDEHDFNPIYVYDKVYRFINK